MNIGNDRLTDTIATHGDAKKNTKQRNRHVHTCPRKKFAYAFYTWNVGGGWGGGGNVG